MPNSSRLNKLMGSSHHIEMIIRRLYRSAIFSKSLKKFNKKKKKAVINKIDFNKIINHLNSLGIKKGDTVIVHSAYSPLKGT